MRKIVFYKVDTALTRHNFDECICWEEVKEALSELQDDEFRVYDLDSKEDVQLMSDDYNDMAIDGSGWWCYVFWGD